MARDRRLTRRDLLQRAGWAAAAAAIPRTAGSATAVAARRRRGVRSDRRRLSDQRRDDEAQHLHERSARPRPARGGARAGEAARAGHDRRDGVRIGADAGPRGDRVCARLRRQGGGDDRRRYDPVRADRSGAGERHDGARRRDRRHAGAGPVASGLQRRARGAGGRRAVRDQRRPLPACRRARLRHRHARHGHHPARDGEQPQAALRHRWHLRRRGGGRLRGQPRRAENALGALLHGAAELRHRVVPPRPRPHRKGVHLRRHARARRRDVGPARPRRLERRERHHGGARQLHPRQRADRQGRAADRQARRALRADAREHQEMDRGTSDPRAARCGRGAAEETADRSEPDPGDRRPLPAGIDHRQQRAVGHQRPARAGGDADRQDGDVQEHPRQGAPAGSGDRPPPGQGAARTGSAWTRGQRGAAAAHSNHARGRHAPDSGHRRSRRPRHRRQPDDARSGGREMPRPDGAGAGRDDDHAGSSTGFWRSRRPATSASCVRSCKWRPAAVRRSCPSIRSRSDGNGAGAAPASKPPSTRRPRSDLDKTSAR